MVLVLGRREHQRRLLPRARCAALEDVCARDDLARARELCATDFIDHVNGLEFRAHDGIAPSLAMYRALFPDLRIDVVDQVSAADRVASRWTLRERIAPGT